MAVKSTDTESLDAHWRAFCTRPENAAPAAAEPGGEPEPMPESAERAADQRLRQALKDGAFEGFVAQMIADGRCPDWRAIRRDLHTALGFVEVTWPGIGEMPPDQLQAYSELVVPFLGKLLEAAAMLDVEFIEVPERKDYDS